MKLPAKKWIAIDERDGEALLPTLSETREMAHSKANIMGAEDWGLRFHIQEILIYPVFHTETKKKLLSQELQ